ncbi:MAG: DNA gyrase subunit A, partial [Gammaproteobacteria bacterium]|nr:DNA gyrase subunit A [Gammaproteobacteria bacterium]
EDEIMLITVGGTLVRTTVAEIPVFSRSAQGVKLIRVGEGERLAGVERIQGLEAGLEDADSVDPADAAGLIDHADPAQPANPADLADPAEGDDSGE